MNFKKETKWINSELKNNVSISFRTTSAICRISSELHEKHAVEDGKHVLAMF